MIQSMTGYGQSTGSFEGKKIRIEIKALNGKASDVRMRLPNNFKEKEIMLRAILLDRLKRGKIDLTIQTMVGDGDDEYNLNKGLFKKYYQEIKSLKDELNFVEGDIVQSILRIPNVVMANDDVMSPKEWDSIKTILDDAILQFLSFRNTEGEAMYKDFVLRIKNLNQLLEDTKEHEDERIEKIKARLMKNLNQHLSSENIDQNRFEQELIFYLERLDITEEKVRLAQHCKYFIEVIDGDDLIKGKKLAFIAQEMGREINTLGAKSQNSALQQIVVNMKDELEKIKEQMANIV